MLRVAKNFLLDLIFPSLCLTCQHYLEKHEGEQRVCDTCLTTVKTFDYLICPTCFSRVTSLRQCHPQTPYLLAAAASYDDPVIKKMIWQFKYERWQSLAQPLGRLLIAFIKNLDIDLRGQYLNEWLVVPMPLTKQRQYERGFNQAELLAAQVSGELGAVLLKDNFVREKNSRPQAEINDWQEREQNIKDAFTVVNPKKFSGQKVILVDDVFTSGATINEAVRVLKLVGVKKIIALTVARAR